MWSELTLTGHHTHFTIDAGRAPGTKEKIYRKKGIPHIESTLTDANAVEIHLARWYVSLFIRLFVIVRFFEPLRQ
jgi:hypothetical protein